MWLADDGEDNYNVTWVILHGFPVKVCARVRCDELCMLFCAYFIDVWLPHKSLHTSEMGQVPRFTKVCTLQALDNECAMLESAVGGERDGTTAHGGAMESNIVMTLMWARK